MRVWELAAELGKKTSELVAELQELGFAVTAAASGLSDEEAEAIRKAYAALGDTEPTAVSGGTTRSSDAESTGGGDGAQEGVQRAQVPQIIPRGDGNYVLVRKGSISAGGVVVQKGGTIPEGEYRALPVRVQKFFDKR